MGLESMRPVWISGVRKRPHFNIYSLKNNLLVLLYSTNRKIGVEDLESTRVFSFLGQSQKTKLTQLLVCTKFIQDRLFIFSIISLFVEFMQGANMQWRSLKILVSASDKKHANAFKVKAELYFHLISSGGSQLQNLQ